MPSITNPPGGNPAPDARSANVSTLVLIFRIVRWTVYACALILLILLLHKPAPPAVSTTPEAAARAEQKFQAIQQAVLEAAVRKMMESPENREKLKLPSDISNLKIENGEVVTQFQ